MKKHRQCPFCKSKNGFNTTYQVKGYGEENRSFKGEVINTEKQEVHDHDPFAECLNCGKQIDIEKLEYNN